MLLLERLDILNYKFSIWLIKYIVLEMVLLICTPWRLLSQEKQRIYIF